jgi:hypothetical protein
MDINSFNNDQHLTHEELVEYNQGNLSNKEMHRLELHLIDCELCNDALDGLTMVDQLMGLEPADAMPSVSECVHNLCGHILNYLSHPHGLAHFSLINWLHSLFQQNLSSSKQFEMAN